jgi:hypothetical protein
MGFALWVFLLRRIDTAILTPNEARVQNSRVIAPNGAVARLSFGDPLPSSDQKSGSLERIRCGGLLAGQEPQGRREGPTRAPLCSYFSCPQRTITRTHRDSVRQRRLLARKGPAICAPRRRSPTLPDNAPRAETSTVPRARSQRGGRHPAVLPWCRFDCHQRPIIGRVSQLRLVMNTRRCPLPDSRSRRAARASDNRLRGTYSNIEAVTIRSPPCIWQAVHLENICLPRFD